MARCGDGARFLRRRPRPCRERSIDALAEGVGFGVGVGGLRIDFGYKTDAIPSSLKVLLRFDRTF
jgi:hypothetical protein